ncbi:MAG: hypothetical protein ACYS9X_26450 [Planctomycetota bacterium]
MKPESKPPAAGKANTSDPTARPAPQVAHPFWTDGEKRSIEELAAEQGVKPITDLKLLRADFWPEDETADEFIAAVREWRREGTDRGSK